MKSLRLSATRKISVIAGIAILTALPAVAEQSNWKIDGDHSTAWIFLGSKSGLQNVGVLPVRGQAEYNSADPAESALSIRGVLPQRLAMTFKSKRSELRADGTLHVVGEMSLDRIETDATYNPGEDYRGPIYGEATVHRVTREVDFVLPPMDNPGPEMEVTAETALGIENFPELFAAVRQAAWQPVLQDGACDAPQAGEDYRGADCKGTLIAPTYQLAAISPGEDYRGDESPAPSGNLLKIVVHLQLKAA
jgi:hypothetical protein